MNLRASNQALIQASFIGNINEVQRLIADGASVNARGSLVDIRGVIHRAVEQDCTPFLAAACGGHLEIMQLLMDKGANPDANMNGGTNAMLNAAYNNHADLVKHLIDIGLSRGEGKEAKKYSIHDYNDFTNTLIHIAAYSGAQEVINLAIDHYHIPADLPRKLYSATPAEIAATQNQHVHFRGNARQPAINFFQPAAAAASASQRAEGQAEQLNINDPIVHAPGGPK